MAVCRRGAGRGRMRRAFRRAADRRPRGRKGRARLPRSTPGTCGNCWPIAVSRSAGPRRRRSWNAGRSWRPIMTCAREHTAWEQRIHAVFFHQGAPQLSAGARVPSRASPRCAPAAPAPVAGWAAAGRHRPDMLTAWGTPEVLRPRLLGAARYLPGAWCWPPAVASGRSPPAMTCWLAGAGRCFLLRAGGPVRRAGHRRLHLEASALPGTCRGGTGGPPAGRVRRPEGSRPRCAARHGLYAQVKAREGGRAPPVGIRQDRPAGLTHPQRARRRRAQTPPERRARSS